MKPEPLLKIKRKRKKSFRFLTLAKNQGGLYTISCTPKFRFYVGESKNVIARLTAHKNLLRRGIHHSDELQKDFNEYGEKCFVFKGLHLGYGSNLKTRQNLETLILSTLLLENRYNAYIHFRHRGGSLNSFYGKSHSYESIEALSLSMSGKPSSFLGKNQSNRVKLLLSQHNKNRGNSKKAIYIDDVFYESILGAYQETGLKTFNS